MNDDTPFLGAELASAFLDNEATPEERARVEVSPDLQAHVAVLAELRARLGDVAPVADAVRESAFAAAMGAFGAAADIGDNADGLAEPPADLVAGVAGRAAPVVSLAARRQKMYRVITGVAAAGVLAVGGLAALNSARGSDEKSSSAADVATTSAAAKIEQAAPAETAAAAETMAGNAAPADTAAPADSVADEAMTSAAAPAADAFDLPAIADPDELAAYATAASDQQRIAVPAAIGCPATTTQLDAGGALLGEVTYAGEPALVVRRADGSVQAVSLLSCAVLTQIPPP